MESRRSLLQVIIDILLFSLGQVMLVVTYLKLVNLKIFREIETSLKFEK